MRTRTNLPLITHAAVCMILGGAFLWFGTTEGLRLQRIGPIGPFHSTDKYLDFLTGTRAGSERLVQVLATLPEKEPIAVVFREGDDKDRMLAYVVSYFAWPRAVHALPVKSDRVASQLKALHATQFSAVFFCGLPPPSALQGVVRLGGNLALVPRPVAPE